MEQEGAGTAIPTAESSVRFEANLARREGQAAPPPFKRLSEAFLDGSNGFRHWT